MDVRSTGSLLPCVICPSLRFRKIKGTEAAAGEDPQRHGCRGGQWSEAKMPSDWGRRSEAEPQRQDAAFAAREAE